MAESLLSAADVDVAVIGEGFPASGGLDLLRRHAGEDGPSFVMVSGRADLIDKVLTLELGAADIVPSPVDVARTGCPSRRASSPGAARDGANFWCWRMRPSTSRRRWSCTGRAARSSFRPGQVALLRLFLANPRKVLSRDDIMAAAPAESAEAFDRSIDSRIVRLRRKLDTESIATIRGAGYRFDPPMPGKD